MKPDLITRFMKRYEREYDYYREVCTIIVDQLQTEIYKRGIKGRVSYRPKDPQSLVDNLRTIEKKRKFSNMKQIYDVMHDLAGVRLELYLPGQASKVEHLITKAFIVKRKKKFPQSRPKKYSYRNPGYTATHYIVHIKDERLNTEQKRFRDAVIEIQVATVLMHAWSEVEHRLVYKPEQGEPGEEEKRILDELNGLVLSGERMLKRLQEATEQRQQREAALPRDPSNLSTMVERLVRREVPDSPKDLDIGTLDALSAFLKKADFKYPDDLKPYLKWIDPTSPDNPIAYQILDSTAADNDHLEVDLAATLTEAHLRNPFAMPEEVSMPESDIKAIGYFVSVWVALERLLRRIVEKRLPGTDSRGLMSAGMLQKHQLFTQDILKEIDNIRKMRNRLLHGASPPTADALISAGQFLHHAMQDLKGHLDAEEEKILLEVLQRIKPVELGGHND